MGAYALYQLYSTRSTQSKVSRLSTKQAGSTCEVHNATHPAAGKQSIIQARDAAARRLHTYI